MATVIMAINPVGKCKALADIEIIMKTAAASVRVTPHPFQLSHFYCCQLHLQLLATSINCSSVFSPHPVSVRAMAHIAQTLHVFIPKSKCE
jgi:hypothetical protein